jgi:signal transduction histidine kinase
MDAEVLRRACKPFFTTRPVGQGVGQGLAIVHQVVHRHGGTLSLASQAGAGTTATVRLPLPAGIPGRGRNAEGNA